MALQLKGFKLGSMEIPPTETLNILYLLLAAILSAIALIYNLFLAWEGLPACPVDDVITALSICTVVIPIVVGVATVFVKDRKMQSIVTVIGLIVTTVLATVGSILLILNGLASYYENVFDNSCIVAVINVIVLVPVNMSYPVLLKGMIRSGAFGAEQSTPSYTPYAISSPDKPASTPQRPFYNDSIPQSTFEEYEERSRGFSSRMSVNGEPAPGSSDSYRDNRTPFDNGSTMGVRDNQPRGFSSRMSVNGEYIDPDHAYHVTYDQPIPQSMSEDYNDRPRGFSSVPPVHEEPVPEYVAPAYGGFMVREEPVYQEPVYQEPAYQEPAKPASTGIRMATPFDDLISNVGLENMNVREYRAAVDSYADTLLMVAPANMSNDDVDYLMRIAEMKIRNCKGPRGEPLSNDDVEMLLEDLESAIRRKS